MFSIVEILHDEQNILKEFCENSNLEQALLVLFRFLGSYDSFKEIAVRFNIASSCVHTIIFSGIEVFLIVIGSNFLPLQITVHTQLLLN